jgi:acetolactate synthase-1/2/3 large subunit
MVRQWQKRFYGERYSQTTLERKTDFVKLAEAFGAQGFRASNPAELDALLAKLADLPSTPTVIDCRICMDEEVLPMIPPGRSVDDMIVTKFDKSGGAG